MATSVDYIEFVCDQIRGAGEIRYKKMFGQYMVCDNTVFVKKLDDIKDKMKDAEVGFPYKGAKEHYILDIENTEWNKAIIHILEEITPLPKPKKKSTK